MNTVELTISSIQMQKFRNIYTLEQGFFAGTIFQELDKPWGRNYG
ncbi:MAG: spore coat associated protein CotJA [Coprobacillaceae bacterium]